MLTTLARPHPIERIAAAHVGVATTQALANTVTAQRQGTGCDGKNAVGDLSGAVGSIHIVEDDQSDGGGWRAVLRAPNPSLEERSTAAR